MPDIPEVRETNRYSLVNHQRRYNTLVCVRLPVRPRPDRVTTPDQEQQDGQRKTFSTPSSTTSPAVNTRAAEMIKAIYVPVVNMKAFRCSSFPMYGANREAAQ